MSSVSPPPRTLLVGVDGSDHAMLACHVAARLARAWRAPLHVVHAWPPYLPATVYAGVGSGMVLTQDTVDVLREGAVAVMTQARAIVQRQGITAVPHLVEATDTADAILAVARDVDAELVVVGRRGLGAVKRLFLGSVSEALVHRSARPLLLLHGDASCWPPRTVVAADDGSAESTLAARLGGDVAAATGATVHVEVASEVPAILAAVAAGPAPVLVAMGTHRRGVASRALLGSVATTVLHDEAVTSVLLAPPAVRDDH